MIIFNLDQEQAVKVKREKDQTVIARLVRHLDLDQDRRADPQAEVLIQVEVRTAREVAQDLRDLDLCPIVAKKILTKSKKIYLDQKLCLDAKFLTCL